jgi:hypothetical protein
MADFHRPAPPGDGDEVGHRGRPALRRPAQVERVRVLLPVQAADQQELPRPGGGDHGPVAVTGALRPVPAGPVLEHGIVYHPVSTDGRSSGSDSDAVVAGDDHHVGERQFPARLPEQAAAPVDLVGGDPEELQPGGCQAPELRDRQVRLRGELQPARDPRLAAALRVLRPAVRHVHVEIDPCLPGRGDEGGEHPGHAILDLPGDARVLRGHARGGTALFQVRGLVERDPRPDQVIRVIRQARRRQRRQRRPRLLPRPPIAPEQGLHPVRPLVPGLLRHAPAVPRHLPRQRPHVIQRRAGSPPLRHDPAQQRADQRIRSRRAVQDIFYAGHRGRGGLLFSHESRKHATAAPRDTPAAPVTAAPQIQLLSVISAPGRHPSGNHATGPARPLSVKQ